MKKDNPLINPDDHIFMNKDTSFWRNEQKMVVRFKLLSQSINNHQLHFYPSFKHFDVLKGFY